MIDTKIAKIQIESDIKDLLGDIKAGTKWEFYSPIRDRIIKKIKKHKLQIWATKRFKELTCPK